MEGRCPENSVRTFFADGRPRILDGGLSTELERAGVDLSTPLWTAEPLASDPASVKAAHLRFLEAGAECICTATYQATYEGFDRFGIGADRADDLFGLAVDLAIEARAEATRSLDGAIGPLVAASIGPFGAMLHDGSEYRGNYGLNMEELIRFHRRRFDRLCDTPADLIAIETLPSMEEIKAIARLFESHPNKPGWVSVCCRNGNELADSTPVGKAVGVLAGVENIVAVGVNCTAPEHVCSLIEKLKECCDKPVIAYPNSGESWNGRTRQWEGSPDIRSIWEYVPMWRRLGAAAIGGCCRVGSSEIRLLGTALSRGS